MDSDDRPPRGLTWTLAGLLLFVGLGGVYGGAMLILDPTGGRLGLPASALEGSPFTSCLVPGVLLFCVNGLASGIGGAAVLWRHPLAGYAGAGLGAFLTAWILVQVALLGLDLSQPLQPLFFLLGIAEFGLGVALARRRPAGMT